MNRIRGLIAVSISLFALSALGLLLLIIDDKKDLSSRASYLSKNSVVKPLVNFPVAEQGYSYNPQIWLPVAENSFLNQNNADTITIFDSSFNSSSASATLGNEFVSKKLMGVDQITLPEWEIEKYTYQLFGDTKKVNLWKNKNYTILEVGQIKNGTQDTVGLIQNLKQQSVLGVSTPDDSAKLATLVRPSIAMVLNHYCAELKFFSAPDFILSDNVYPFCLTSVGSGFFVDSTGLLITNGHIVKNLPKSALFYGISSGKLDNLLVDFLGVYFTQTTKVTYPVEEITKKVKEAHKNKDVLYQLGGLVTDLNNKNILKFQNETNKYFLQLGNEAAQITSDGVKESAGVVSAELIDLDYQEQNPETGFVSSDVALLKPSNGVYLGLSLGSISDAVVGSNLSVVGFPGAAMSASNLLDGNSISEPTFTKGVVSAIKTAKGNQKNLIQTDAIINHGNSGGPALLLNGKVVGIATYGVTAEDGSGSYNFLRDIQDAKDLITKNNLKTEQGEVYSLWQEGLKNYWLGYYKYSSENFNKLKTLYSVHPSVEKYLTDSNTKIGSIEDQTPKFTHKQRSTYMMLAGLTMSVSVITFLVSLYFLYQQKKQNQSISSAPTF